MEPDPQTNTPPKRRAKWIVVGAITLVLLASVLLIHPDNAMPITVGFVNTVQDYHPPTIPDVPCFAISNRYRGALHMDLQLECQSNGVWIPWPPHPATNGITLIDLQLAQWQETILSNATFLVHPVQRPFHTSMEPMRLHGIVAKEKLGPAAWPDRIVQYVRNRWLQPQTKIRVIKPAGVSGTPMASFVPAVKLHFYYTGMEFFTSPLRLTNESGPLTVSRSDEAH